ncbi:hypothetical protein, partial [Alkalihalobacillus trypoxylicola]|uniref:hypothetical protein n=1 Tax=Alkalihalobacillus trypoxylicola TaxID=519424 RepID=UPI001C3FE34E
SINELIQKNPSLNKNRTIWCLIFILGRYLPKGLPSANSDYAECRQRGFSNGADPLGDTTYRYNQQVNS